MSPDAARQLDGQWAVVTGSSRGIGRAIALELAKAAARVILHGRDQRALEAAAQEIRAVGGECEAVVADLADGQQRRMLLHEACDGRQVAIWINNAGADVLTGEAANLPFEEKLDLLWNVDVKAAVELSRGIGGHMRQHGGGVILNMGWDRADVGMEGDSGEMFALTKGAVMSFSRSLAKSLAPKVRVNCLAPGWIRTAWGKDASDSWQRRATGDSLRGRWGEPEDVARIAAFLASPAADFVNGQVVSINGGLSGSSGR